GRSSPPIKGLIRSSCTRRRTRCSSAAALGSPFQFHHSTFPPMLEKWKNGKLSDIEFAALDFALSIIKGRFAFACPLLPESLALLGVAGLPRNLSHEVALLRLPFLAGQRRDFVPEVCGGLLHARRHQVSPMQMRVRGFPLQVVHAGVVEQTQVERTIRSL